MGLKSATWAHTSHGIGLASIAGRKIENKEKSLIMTRNSEDWVAGRKTLTEKKVIGLSHLHYLEHTAI